MREIALFGEDFAHQQVIGALAQRLADECGIMDFYYGSAASPRARSRRPSSARAFAHRSR